MSIETVPNSGRNVRTGGQLGRIWSRANNSGAVTSIVLGLTVWLGMEFIAPEAALPPQFAGFIASILGMVAGTLLRPARIV